MQMTGQIHNQKLKKQFNQENQNVKKSSNWKNIMPIATVYVKKCHVKWNLGKITGYSLARFGL